MMGEVRRTLLAVVISLVLVATAVASLWLMASAGVFDAGGSPLPGAPAVVSDDAETVLTFPPGGNVQVSQPRDPFEPLATIPVVVDGSSTTAGETTSTTGDGTTTTSGDGTTTSTAGDGATTTTAGDDPIGTRIALLEVREEDGVKVAVVTVDGQTYTVGVGDEFADDLKVVSLSEASGVFQIDDRVFSLIVGQSILK
jgi:hypothetical protein